MKRWKPLIAIACLVAVVSIIALLARDKEPRYRGRSLSEWARMRETSFPDEYILTADANQAIRSIGTNAIPTVLRWISHEPSRLTRVTWTLLDKLPSGLKPHFARPYNRGWDAYEVLSVLGPEARSAIPELTRLGATSRDGSCANLCARSLANFGPEALPALVTIITTPQSKARFYGILFLQRFGTNAGPAVPAVLKSLSDQDDKISGAAAATLGKLAISDSTVVPALTANLQSTNARDRAYAAIGLAGFGSRAKAAIPQLQCALADPSESVRAQVTNAFLQIAPELLTNPPAHNPNP